MYEEEGGKEQRRRACKNNVEVVNTISVPNYRFFLKNNGN